MSDGDIVHATYENSGSSVTRWLQVRALPAEQRVGIKHKNIKSMAKRRRGLGRRQKSSSRKTKKRLAIKHEMLAKRRQHK